MPNEDCTKLGIPDYLHKDDRQDNQEFDEGELIYRRFYVSGNVNDWKKNNDISRAVFEIKNDSFNRSKYSEKPEDVLYNDRPEDHGKHYLNHGILSIPVSGLLFKKKIEEKVKQEIITRTFTIVVKHTSKKCIYPHCEIFVLENGNQIDSNKPKTVKIALREFLLDLTNIVKNPS